MTGRPALDATGAGGAASMHSHPSRGRLPAVTLPPRLADKDPNVSTENPPGDLPPDDQRVEVAVERLYTLSDEELAAFVCQLDGALRHARSGPADDALNDITTVAANARHLLRQRRARTAGARAKALVDQLLGTGANG